MRGEIPWDTSPSAPDASPVNSSGKAPVYTADKSWKKLKVGARVHVIR